MYIIRINDEIFLSNVVEFTWGKKFFYAARNDGTCRHIKRKEIQSIEKNTMSGKRDWSPLRAKRFNR